MKTGLVLLRWLVVGLLPAAIMGIVFVISVPSNISFIPHFFIRDMMFLLATVALFGLYLATFTLPTNWWYRAHKTRAPHFLHIVLGSLFCIIFAIQALRFFVVYLAK